MTIPKEKHFTKVLNLILLEIIFFLLEKEGKWYKIIAIKQNGGVEYIIILTCITKNAYGLNNKTWLT